MPEFAYECQVCDHTEERGKPDLKLDCPKCRMPESVRRVYRFAIGVVPGAGGSPSRTST